MSAEACAPACDPSLSSLMWLSASRVKAPAPSVRLARGATSAITRCGLPTLLPTRLSEAAAACTPAAGPAWASGPDPAVRAVARRAPRAP